MSRPKTCVWVVTLGDGARLGGVLSRARADDRAVADGRVFVGRRRATSLDDGVTVGDVVTVSEPGEASLQIVILAREDGLVVVDKPAGVATIPDHAGSRGSLLGEVAAQLGVSPTALHPTSRLDREVSGVVFFAERRDAAERLRLARERGEYVRRYIGIASRPPEPGKGQWSAPIGRAKDPRHRAAFGREAADSLSRYATVAQAGTTALLALEPVTGRTHQLRVHAAHAGAPLLGDRTYGGPHRLTLASGTVVALDRIALHAARVRVPRADGSVLEVVSAPAAILLEWWRSLGGEPRAWQDALGDDLIV